MNLETTGGHSVRFNPNLYNDGKVGQLGSCVRCNKEVKQMKVFPLVIELWISHSQRTGGSSLVNTGLQTEMKRDLPVSSGNYPPSK